MNRNQFLNELAVKLAKKSVDSSKLNPMPIGPKAPPLPINKIVEEKHHELDNMSPRKKKKARTKRNFDDY